MNVRILWVVIAVICQATASAGSTRQYLFNRADFPSDQSPVALAVADLNGDGNADVVVANQANISVFLGQADGTLGSKSDYIVAQGSPNGVVVADFNGDGKLDIAVSLACGPTCGEVSVLLGNGDGTFGEHTDFSTGTLVSGLAVADFNGDGKMDLAVVNASGIAILLGRGDGTFSPDVEYATGPVPVALVVADFNGDGIADVAVADSCGSSCGFVSVLLGNGDGTFQAHKDSPTAAGPWGIAAGDFDGDKIPDILVSLSVAQWGVAFMKGNGDGTFQAEQMIVPNLATSVVSAVDVNGDGKLDMVVTVVSQGGVGVFLGNGDGTFQAETNYATGAYPLGLAIQDMNGDGNVDLIVSDWESNYLTILLGNGDGTFSPRTNVPPGPVEIAQTDAIAGVVGDFNGDGIPDLAIAEGSVDYLTGGVSVLLGEGKGKFQTPVTTNSNGALGVIVAADFNNDGRLDVAVPNENGAVAMMGNGDGSFGTQVQVVSTQAVAARSLVTGDFNNDGNQDLVVVANGFLQSQPIYVVLGNGDGTFKPAKQFWNSSSIPIAIAAGDFNHDGKLDIVVTLNPIGIAVMLGNGDGTFASPVTYATDDLPSGLTVADVNGDGIPDVIATAEKIDVFLGKGDGTFAEAVTYNGGNFPNNVIVADVNGDGKPDIVAAAEGNAAMGALEILLGNGNGTFQAPLEIISGSFGLLAAGDLNQDGTVDIFTSGYPGAIFFSGPIATLSPATMNFGAVGVTTTSAARGLSLTNSGNAPLEIAGVSTTADYATTSSCGNSVALLSSCTINVTFSPTTTGGTSGSLTVTDNAPRGQQKVALSGAGFVDFSVAPASTTLPLQPGAQGTDIITFAGIGGSFNNAIQITCSVSGPTPAPTCGMSPTAVTPGSAAATSTLTVTAPASVATFQQRRSPSGALPPWVVGLFFLGVLRAATGPKRRLRWVLCGSLAAMIFLQVACGGGNGGGGSSPQNYTVSVTATSGSIQHSIQLTATVQ